MGNFLSTLGISSSKHTRSARSSVRRVRHDHQWTRTAHRNTGTPTRYNKIRALLLSHETDDTRCREELGALGRVLRRSFDGTVARWEIPQIDSYFELQYRLEDFILESDDPNELLWVYYGGHGLYDPDCNSPMELRIHANRRSVNNNIVLDPLIFDLLFNTPKDTLVTLDCCHAGALFRGDLGGRKEILAACAYGVRTPQARRRRYGSSTFTRYLTQALESFHEPFTIADLHRRILLWKPTAAPVNYPYPDPTDEMHKIWLIPLRGSEGRRH